MESNMRYRSLQRRYLITLASFVFGVAFDPITSKWSSFCENTSKVLSEHMSGTRLVDVMRPPVTSYELTFGGFGVPRHLIGFGASEHVRAVRPSPNKTCDYESDKTRTNLPLP
jgi:hypothetical protein